jgi:putative ABC transport system permease protein
LLKNPGFTAVAVLTLGLGIGANTAVFSVINAVLYRPLPFHDSDRLVWLYHNKPLREWIQFPLSTRKFKFWQEHSRTFEQLGLAGPTDFHLNGEGSPELLRGLKVTANLSDLLGVQPVLGRSFRPEENQPGAPRVALLSHRLWQRRFAADPEIVGKTIRQHDQSYTIVGVLPPQLKFPIGPMPAWRVLSTGEPDLWLPITFIPPGEPDGEVGFAIARLKPGVSAAQAQAEMRAVTQQHERIYPETEGWSIDVVPLREQAAGQIRPALMLLFGAVGAVLLIACVNVANLLLARAMNRQKEFDVRAALGAGRLQLVRQLLTESMLLSGLGGCLGVLFAFCGVRTLTALSPVSLPLAKEVQIDAGVLAFTFSVSLLAGLLFGLAPAWHVWRHNPGRSIRSVGQNAAGHFRRQPLRHTLVMGEVALSLVLLISSGLLVRSFVRVLNVNLGYQPESLLVMNLSFASPKYPTGEAKDAFVKTLLSRIEGLPGVSAAGFSFGMPLAKGVPINKPFKIESRAGTGDDSYLNVRLRIVSPSYFAAMGIPLRKGTGFSATSLSADGESHEVILNESAARKVFLEEDPIGKRCNFGPIVGIVGDTLDVGLDKVAEPQFYIVGYSSAEAFLIVRTGVAPDAVKSAVTKEVAAVDKDLPVHNLQTMETMVSQSLALRRFQMFLLTTFGAVALLLTAIGIYGVVAYGVSQRMREIGIRTALGAQASDVLKLVLREGMRPVLIGVVLGSVAALGITRVLASQLFGVGATDPATFATVWLVLVTVATAACWLPARRAACVDPMEALRHE